MESGWPNELDLNKFPGGMISGLTLAQINEVCSHNIEESSNNDIDPGLDFDETLFEELNIPDEQLLDCFNYNEGDIPSCVKEQLDETERSMMSASTIQQEKLHSSRFIEFLKKGGIYCDLLSVKEETLNNYLRYFYHELRTIGGRYYSPKSLQCIRAGIHRYLTRTLNRNVNILTGEAFASANRMLLTMTGLWLAHGGQSRQFIAIEKKDLDTIYTSFDRKSGESLQNEVLFAILYFLGARGREELRKLKRSDICIEFDSNGVKYVRLKCEKDDKSEPNNLRKNVKASLQPREYSVKRMNRIYDTRAIECIELYIAKISRDQPSTDNLFPRPINNKKSNQFYSSKQVRGESYLGQFMKKLSETLELTKIYTNHCVRCTTVSIAKDKGLSNSDVCLITGHKDARSIDNYDRPSDERIQMLNSAISLNSSVEQSSSTSMRTVKSCCGVSIMKESIAVEVSPEKKMCIEANGNTNIVSITFT